LKGFSIIQIRFNTAMDLFCVGKILFQVELVHVPVENIFFYVEIVPIQNMDLFCVEKIIFYEEHVPIPLTL
jgi:hypothetical protein